MFRFSIQRPTSTSIHNIEVSYQKRVNKVYPFQQTNDANETTFVAWYMLIGVYISYKILFWNTKYRLMKTRSYWVNFYSILMLKIVILLHIRPIKTLISFLVSKKIISSKSFARFNLFIYKFGLWNVSFSINFYTPEEAGM